MINKNTIEVVLRREGFKITRQRRAVLTAINENHDHLTPADIYEKALTQHPGIGLVTVYRTLEILGKLGLICEVYTGGNTRSYLMRRPSYHHHHLVCSGCGTVVDFADCDLSELADRLSQETGFAIESHLLEFTGRCMDCQSRLNK